MGQDLENHVKGDFVFKADPKFRKNETENTSGDKIYHINNLNKQRGKYEHYQIQNLFDYMHQVYAANRKYIEFNKIKKVDHVIGKEFDTLFPPRKGTQPYIFQENIINKEIWDDKYTKGKKKCSYGKTLGACIFPGFIDQENKKAICAQSADSYNAFNLLFDKFIVEGPRQKEFVCGGY